MSQAMGRAKSLAGGFTPGQRGIVLVAMVALVLGAVALTKWVAQPSWTPLYSQLSGQDASAIVEELRSQNTQYKLADGGNTVLVPQSQVYDLRVSLSGKGLPSTTGKDGWSILNQQGMTATELQQNAAYQQALEGELNRTLGAISGVNTAIVRLSMPTKDVFATEEEKPKAAVLLALAPGTTLSKSQIRSVTHLVAGSVPGLQPGKVSVSDGNGILLTPPDDAGTGTGNSPGLAGDADEQTAQYEDRKAAEIQRMLDTMLGPGNSVVRVSAELDFSKRHSTTESYLPSPVTPLSEQTSRETYANPSAGAGGLLGVITPSPVASRLGTNGYLKEERTVNNGVGKAVTEEESAPGAPRRLSVAVVVDSEAAGGVDSAKLQQIVASAVGIDPQRGDVVQVDLMPFDRTASETTKKELEAVQKAQKTAGYIDVGKKAGMVLLIVIVAIILMLKRPGGRTTVDATARDLPGGMLMPSRIEAIGAERMRELGVGPAGGLEMGGMTEQQPALEREKLRDEVSAFVDSQPEEIAQLVQGWLSRRGD